MGDPAGTEATLPHEVNSVRETLSPGLPGTQRQICLHTCQHRMMGARSPQCSFV